MSMFEVGIRDYLRKAKNMELKSLTKVRMRRTPLLFGILFLLITCLSLIAVGQVGKDASPITLVIYNCLESEVYEGTSMIEGLRNAAMMLDTCLVNVRCVVVKTDKKRPLKGDSVAVWFFLDTNYYRPDSIIPATTSHNVLNRDTSFQSLSWFTKDARIWTDGKDWDGRTHVYSTLAAHELLHPFVGESDSLIPTCLSQGALDQSATHRHTQECCDALRALDDRIPGLLQNQREELLRGFKLKSDSSKATQ